METEEDEVSKFSHLGPNLITTLAGLNVNYLSHHLVRYELSTYTPTLMNITLHNLHEIKSKI